MQTPCLLLLPLKRPVNTVIQRRMPEGYARSQAAVSVQQT